MDRLPFLRPALLASRPAAIVDTLLAKYRCSSTQQQQVAWTAFQQWFPQTATTVSRDDILCFLHYLFSDKGLAPHTTVNYRSALQWPLEEAFHIDFSQLDFSRLATGFFQSLSARTTDRPSMELVCCRPLLRTGRSQQMFPQAPTPQGSVSHRPSNRQSMIGIGPSLPACRGRSFEFHYIASDASLPF